MKASAECGRGSHHFAPCLSVFRILSLPYPALSCCPCSAACPLLHIPCCPCLCSAACASLPVLRCQSAGTVEEWWGTPEKDLNSAISKANDDVGAPTARLYSPWAVLCPRHMPAPCHSLSWLTPQWDTYCTTP